MSVTHSQFWAWSPEPWAESLRGLLASLLLGSPAPGAGGGTAIEAPGTKGTASSEFSREAAPCPGPGDQGGEVSKCLQWEPCSQGPGPDVLRSPLQTQAWHCPRPPHAAAQRCQAPGRPNTPRSPPCACVDGCPLQA